MGARLWRWIIDPAFCPMPQGASSAMGSRGSGWRTGSSVPLSRQAENPRFRVRPGARNARAFRRRRIVGPRRFA
jgi:hypothetical protein